MNTNGNLVAELQRTSTIIQTSLDCHSYMYVVPSYLGLRHSLESMGSDPGRWIYKHVSTTFSPNQTTPELTIGRVNRQSRKSPWDNSLYYCVWTFRFTGPAAILVGWAPSEYRGLKKSTCTSHRAAVLVPGVQFETYVWTQTHPPLPLRRILVPTISYSPEWTAIPSIPHMHIAGGIRVGYAWSKPGRKDRLMSPMSRQGGMSLVEIPGMKWSQA